MFYLLVRKQLLRAASTFVLFSLCSICWPAVFANEPLRATVTELPDRILVDLGVLRASMRSDFEVHLENQTTDDLSLASVDTSCGCVKVTSNKSVVRKGTYTVLQLSVLPSAREDLLRQQIKLNFSESSVYPVVLIVEGRVKRDVELIPNVINFKGSKEAKTIVIQASSDKIEIVKCFPRRGIVAVHEQHELDGGRLSVSFVPEIKSGQGVELLSVHYRDEGAEKETEVPLSIASGNKFRFIPSSLNLLSKGSCDTTLLFMVGETDKSAPKNFSFEVLDVEGKTIPRSSVSVEANADRPRAVQVKVCVLDDDVNPHLLVAVVDGQRHSCKLRFNNDED